MQPKVITKETDFNGKPLKLETGKLATQADAAVVATVGETVVLATVATKPMVEDIGYFPLSVEYVEKHYAGGRITPQKFIKREGRPSDKAILSGRAIDRSIRPLFPKDFKNEVQVILSVLSFDNITDPMVVGFIAASAALSISSVPFAGPLGISRVGAREGQLVMNPDLTDLEHLEMDLLVATTSEKIVMVEAEGREIGDEFMFDSIKSAFDNSQSLIQFISDFQKEAGKEKLVFVPVVEQISDPILDEVKNEAKTRIEEGLKGVWHEATGDMIKSALVAKYADLTPIQVNAIFDKVAKEIMNDTVLNQKRRVDGRGMTDVRELYIETGLLPRTHGSALFQRGGTQVLSIATLGPLSVSQTLEGMEGESTKRFMHHYNMGINPFSTGEVKRIGSPNRRDIGHGNLVEKSLRMILPNEAEFPYAMRVVSEVLGANASTSQASVCATSLSLINAGVKIPGVAGIAMGLITDHDNINNFQVITDMQATEDFYGEMDFKVAGTTKGITGIQMDTKLTGITFDIVKEALSQGKAARELILSKMAPYIPAEVEISKYAPKIEVTHIAPESIGMLIGPGGKNINGIIAKTGAQIDIEDDGTVMVSSMSDESIKAALDAINGMFKKVAVGEEYDGKVVKLMPFGAFVEILPGKDGLLHVSQMSTQRVEAPEDVVSEGQEVHVRVIEVDPQGKIGLSMLSEEESKAKGGDRGGNRGGGGFGGGDRGPRRDSGDRPRRSFGDRGGDRGGDRPRRNFGGDRGGDRGPRRDGGNRSGGFGRGPSDRNRRDR